MHYGHPPHKFAESDVIIFHCKRDGWSDAQPVKGMGVPYYCPACGQPVSSYLRYDPSDQTDLGLVAKIRARTPA